MGSPLQSDMQPTKQLLVHTDAVDYCMFVWTTNSVHIQEL